MTKAALPVAITKRGKGERFPLLLLLLQQQWLRPVLCPLWMKANTRRRKWSQVTRKRRMRRREGGSEGRRRDLRRV